MAAARVCHFRRRPPGRAAPGFGALTLALLCASTAVRAVPLCPLPEQQDFGPIDDSNRVVISADRAEVSAEGDSELSGGVIVQRGTQRLETEGASWDRAAGKVTALHGARFIQPGFEVVADSLVFMPGDGMAILTGNYYRLPLQPASGGAERIQARDTGRIEMDGVTYTTCPGDDPDWLLKIDRLRLYGDKEIGEAERVSLRFFGVPLFYLPYLSFPLSDRRKSGFLVPEFRQSQRSGFEVHVPYYFNLAPNYDYVVTPTVMSSRGLLMANDFRYLSDRSLGEVSFDYLHRDEELPDNDTRIHFNLAHVTRFDNGWRFTAALEDVSDTTYFQDLGRGPQVTSRTYVERLLQADYTGDVWRITGRMQNFRTLDLEIPEDERPYARLPQVMASALWRDGPLGLDWRLRTEAGGFTRDVGPEGGRAVFEPGISLPLEAAGFFLTPSATLRTVQYELTDQPAGADSSPGYAAPILSVDSGLRLERDIPDGGFVQTLEPRILYAYIPRRDQDGLPLFDTTRPDFNYIQLFRPDRYLGFDRLGDTNQLSFGLMTRLLESSTGREFLTASLGKAWYFADPLVTLPGEEPSSASGSPIVLELGLGLIKNWNADIGYQWSNEDSETRLAQFRVQYQPAANRVVNLSYRYRPELLEDLAFSMGWRVAQRWSLVGAIEYSLRDKSTVDRLAGVQYETCCWAVRFAATEQVSRRDGSSDNAVQLQIEFKGLGGGGARDRFESAILGYSLYE
jgi:LPS-assembly protein